MGRHSLPNDDEPADGTELVGDPALDDEPRGRHSWRPGAEQSVAVLEPEATPGADTAPVPVVADTGPVPVVAETELLPFVVETESVSGGAEPQSISGSAGTERAPARKPSGMHADLALLRANRRLRVRAIAAVLAPFALYVLTLAVLGRLDVLLLWVWIPVIVAGVSFGAVLDLGAGKAASSGDTPEESEDVSG